MVRFRGTTAHSIRNSHSHRALHRKRIILIVGVLVSLMPVATSAEEPASERARSEATAVYGHWRIRIRPDRGREYNDLIAQQGLPLFREAGGRMLGWWTTVVGDLYEHVTIWQYDNMAAFEAAIAKLGADERFARFAAARDPLLVGEESCFLRLVDFSRPPALHEPARFVVHEVHRVPLAKQVDYYRFMRDTGLPLLEKHGFRPAGPWRTELGQWTELTYLLRFESLAERDQLIARLAAHEDAQTYMQGIDPLTDEITTTLLAPAPFARDKKAEDTTRGASAETWPARQLSPGVCVLGGADRFASANIGWMELDESVCLLGAGWREWVEPCLEQIRATTTKPVSGVMVTEARASQPDDLQALKARGIEPLSPARLRQAAPQLELIELGRAATDRDVAVHVRDASVLFAGAVCVNGPRARLAGSDTAAWIAALARLEGLNVRTVVPGYGSIGGRDLLTRTRRYLEELRRQVGYLVAQGRPLEVILREIRVAPDYLVWMPYDTPNEEDITHVYRELTVPHAPFDGQPLVPRGERPRALVLVGDRFHDPAHLMAGLERALLAARVEPHFIVDVRALSSENLRQVELLVILRDGMLWPDGGEQPYQVWMTREQEQAVVDFVAGGGAFMPLHNATGLYPENGPYLRLVGGTYQGHGPLERFSVTVRDLSHPVTRGVTFFEVADEQHTPQPDLSRVHPLMESRSADGITAAAGWAYEEGRGRVCYLAPGHTREALLHPAYQRLLANAARWCLRQEGP